MPIANEHLDSGCHCLTAGVPLGLASSLPRPQMLEFEHGGSCISIVSHGPSPSQCRSLISAPNMAVRGRPLGAIWAAYLFVPNKKPRPGRMVGGAQSFDRDQRLACNHGLAANLHKLLFSSNWLLLVKFAGEFANGSQSYAGQVG